MNSLFSPIHQLWHHHYRPSLITVTVITALIWVLALTQPHKLTEGAWTVNLTGGCHLDYHARPSRPSPWPAPPWTICDSGRCLLSGRGGTRRIGRNLGRGGMPEGQTKGLAVHKRVALKSSFPYTS
jgi:hypothetical protein